MRREGFFGSFFWGGGGLGFLRVLFCFVWVGDFYVFLWGEGGGLWEGLWDF